MSKQQPPSPEINALNSAALVIIKLASACKHQAVAIELLNKGHTLPPTFIENMQLQANAAFDEVDVLLKVLEDLNG